MIHVILLLLLTFHGHSANHRGTFTGNNGNVLKMIDGSVRFADVLRHPEFEYFDLLDEPEWEEINKKIQYEKAMNQTTVFFYSTLSPLTLFSNALKRSLTQLRFFLVNTPIPDKKDKGSAVYKSEGQVEPLAVQYRQNDMVFINRALFKELSKKDRTAFFFHEALIHIWYEMNYHDDHLNSTAPIADFVEILFREKNRPMSARKMSFQLCGAKIFLAPGDHTHYELNKNSDYNTHFVVYDHETCLLRHFRPTGKPPKVYNTPNDGAKVAKIFYLEEEYLGQTASAFLEYGLYDSGVQIDISSSHANLRVIWKDPWFYNHPFRIYKPKDD